MKTKTDIPKELAAMEKMTAGQLRVKHRELFGEDSRSGNRQWLFRRCVWRLQALAEGDLSQRARRRAKQLARDVDIRLRPPAEMNMPPMDRPADVRQPARKYIRRNLDARLPMPGTRLKRDYKGHTYPPSINHYWRRVGPRTLISREGRTFRKNVCALLGGDGPRKPPSDGRIALAMDAFPPDRRRRDLDNIAKSVLDSLEHVGIYDDDSQIDLLLIRRCEPVKGGRLDVRVDELPLRRCPLCRGRIWENN